MSFFFVMVQSGFCTVCHDWLGEIFVCKISIRKPLCQLYYRFDLSLPCFIFTQEVSNSIHQSFLAWPGNFVYQVFHCLYCNTMSYNLFILYNVRSYRAICLSFDTILCNLIQSQTNKKSITFCCWYIHTKCSASDLFCVYHNVNDTAFIHIMTLFILVNICIHPWMKFNKTCVKECTWITSAESLWCCK